MANQPTVGMPTVTPSTGGGIGGTVLMGGVALIFRMLGGLGSPVANLILGLFAAGKEDRALELANEANEENDREVRRIINEIGEEGGEAAREIGRMGIRAALQNFNTTKKNAGISNEDFARFVTSQREAYGQRTQTGMGMLKGFGQAERGDIKSYYADLAARTRSGIRNRGMGGSTIMESMERGVGRDRTQQLGLQRDREATLRSSVYGLLSGEELAATSAAERDRIERAMAGRERIRLAEQAVSRAPMQSLALQREAAERADLLAVEHLQGLRHDFAPSATTQNALNSMQSAGAKPWTQNLSNAFDWSSAVDRVNFEYPV
jgi:hypothetical protein